MRPKIICHMISSVDGRLLAKRWTPPALGIEADIAGARYEATAAKLAADGWIVGRKTMEAFARPAPQPAATRTNHPRRSFVGHRDGRNLAIAIDPAGKLHYGQDHAAGDHLVAILGEQVSDAYLSELRAIGVSYVFAGRDGRDLRRALESLGHDFGVKVLLLEGGGITNGQFLQAGLIDEISLLIYPGIDGLAGIPSVFEFIGKADERPARGKVLRHLATETLVGGVVWLRYRVEDESPAT